MAIIHRATISPTKLELLAAWVPAQPWAAGTVPDRLVGGFRFDDPAGEVGIEVVVLADAADRYLQVPVTYRAAPLDEAPASAFIGTTEHSVLGTRWVYDGLIDPVAVAAYTAGAVGAVAQAREWVQTGEGGQQEREPLVRATTLHPSAEAPAPVSADRRRAATDADPARIPVSSGVIAVHRLLDADRPVGATPTLVATWDGQISPVVLAEVLPAD
ncbi:maltokinase N-terminal cap-like domain-containing protein [Nakamurella leprariae]|uniref:Maltokinase N-terminal cap domain-containing protein n=1 Tax=Nakamurella leprariae TaxID=2803911 RepID=A0A939BXH0_9ACTN|nr:hypothetical protein [Nakamurella leprariae]MBM9465970.1 hypothetical protein [Nakamurella leprariae]